MNLFYTKDLPCYWYTLPGSVEQRLGVPGESCFGEYAFTQLEDAKKRAGSLQWNITQCRLRDEIRLSKWQERVIGFRAKFDKNLKKGLDKYHQRIAKLEQDLDDAYNVKVSYVPQTLESPDNRLTIGDPIWFVDTWGGHINKCRIAVEEICYYGRELRFRYDAAYESGGSTKSDVTFYGDLSSMYSNYSMFLSRDAAVDCLSKWLQERQWQAYKETKEV